MKDTSTAHVLQPHLVTPLLLDVEVTSDLWILRRDHQEHQPSRCEQAQNADKERFLLERFPSKLTFTGLTAKGRNNLVCRHLYPREDLSPDCQSVQENINTAISMLVYLAQRKPGSQISHASLSYPLLTLLAPTEQPTIMVPTSCSAVKTASSFLRNKQTWRCLKFPTIFFLSNVTMSFLAGREVLIEQLYSGWYHVTYERQSKSSGVNTSSGGLKDFSIFPMVGRYCSSKCVLLKIKYRVPCQNTVFSMF